MTSPESGGPTAYRERLLGLVGLGVAAVLLLSSPTWFAGGRTWVGLAQLGLAAVLLVTGGTLYRRAGRAG